VHVGRAASMKRSLQTFLEGKVKKMPEDEFKEAKALFRKMRADALREAMRSLPSDSIDWLLSRDRPSQPPPVALRAFDQDRGSTFAVQPRSGAGFSGQVSFHKGDMITHAYDLARKGGTHVAALNMANQFVPGGSFLGGARAQEEQFCHRSDLFPRLKVHKFYNDELYIGTGACLVTRGVDIMRSDKGSGFQPMDPTRVTVLSAAAKNYHNADLAKADPQLPVRMLDTWRAVLSAAGACDAEQLVLSALGCGAFCNPPEAVGRSLALALQECNPGAKLREVHVVIYEDHNSGGVNFSQFVGGYRAAGAIAGSSVYLDDE